MNPFSPPPGPYPNEPRPADRIPVPDERRPARRNAVRTYDRPPAECRSDERRAAAGMQYPTYYGSMPGMRGPTTIPPVPAPARARSG